MPLEYTDTAAAIANMTVPYGIYIEDYSDLEQEAEEIAHIDLIDEELVKKDRTKSVIHIYISECDNAEESLAFLKERLAAEKIPFEAGAVGVNDNDWNENWKKYFHATEIGKRLAIVPSWESYENVSCWAPKRRSGWILTRNRLKRRAKTPSLIIKMIKPNILWAI